MSNSATEVWSRISGQTRVDLPVFSYHGQPQLHSHITYKWNRPAVSPLPFPLPSLPSIPHPAHMSPPQHHNAEEAPTWSTASVTIINTISTPIFSSNKSDSNPPQNMHVNKPQLRCDEPITFYIHFPSKRIDIFWTMYYAMAAPFTRIKKQSYPWD